MSIEPYARSVWYKEVDTALHKLLKEKIYYLDSTRQVAKIEPLFHVNDKDLNSLFANTNIKLPTVIIKKIGEQFDLRRYDPKPIIVSTEGSKATQEESAKPYILRYQLDFVASYQTDIDYITRTWLSAIPKRSDLEVIDIGGTLRKCYMLQSTPLIPFSALVSGENTLYRSVMTYDVWVELDEGLTEVINLATDINILNKP